MKTFKAVFKPDAKGVYAISLVENPAMEGEFVQLSKDKVQLKQINKDKNLFLGLVLEPNKLIYRNDDKHGEYNIVFDEETIVKLAHNFKEKDNHHNSTIEHDGVGVEGITFVEQWIVADPLKDKSAVYGLNYPKGSWLSVVKIDNKEILEDYVSSGKVKGFSIDAMVDFEEVTKLSNMSDNKSILEEIKELATSIKLALTPEKKEVALGSVKSADGSVTISYEGEELKEGVPVFVLDEEGSRVPLEVGEYETEAGDVISVKEVGFIASVGAKPVEEAPQEEKQELEQAEGSVGADVQKEMNSIKQLVVKYSEDLSDLKTSLSAKDKKIEDLEKEITELKEQPADEPIKTELSNINKAELTAGQRYLLERNG